MAAKWSVTNAAVNTGYGINLDFMPRAPRIPRTGKYGAYAGIYPPVKLRGGDLNFDAFNDLEPNLQNAMQNVTNAVANEVNKSIEYVASHPDVVINFFKKNLPKAWYKVKGFFKKIFGKKKKKPSPEAQRKLAAFLNKEFQRGAFHGLIDKKSMYDDMSIADIVTDRQKRKKQGVPKAATQGERIHNMGESLRDTMVFTKKLKARTDELKPFAQLLKSLKENGQITAAKAKELYRQAVMGELDVDSYTKLMSGGPQKRLEDMTDEEIDAEWADA